MILSRFPIVETRCVNFPGFATWETVAAGKKRGVLCTIRLDDGSRVRVLAVHLSHRSENVRIASCHVIEETRSASDSPLIVAGDFNSTPSSFPHSQSGDRGRNAMDLLFATDAYRWLPIEVGDPSRCTFHSQKPQRVIDWILIPANWRFQKYEVDATTLSDHRPIFAAVEIDGNDEP